MKNKNVNQVSDALVKEREKHQKAVDKLNGKIQAAENKAKSVTSDAVKLAAEYKTRFDDQVKKIGSLEWECERLRKEVTDLQEGHGLKVKKLRAEKDKAISEKEASERIQHTMAERMDFLRTENDEMKEVLAQIADEEQEKDLVDEKPKSTLGFRLGEDGSRITTRKDPVDVGKLKKGLSEVPSVLTEDVVVHETEGIKSVGEDVVPGVAGSAGSDEPQAAAEEAEGAMQEVQPAVDDASA